LLTGETICSDELYRIYELNPEEPPPTYEQVRKMIHADDVAHVDEMVNSLMQTHRPIQLDYKITTKTGKLKYITSDILVEFNDSKPVRHYGSVQDITEIKLVEEKLRNTNENNGSAKGINT
jgi:PAS domain-containing protein